MAGVLIFILELILLYFLSRNFIQKLFNNIFRITRDREKAAAILGWIFLPGTFIHEISHFITALFLIVPVGKINLMPEVTDGGVKLGSVGIGKTDFIRGSIIGLAPIIFGGGITLSLIYYIFLSGDYLNLWFVAIFIYLIFEITNTMFSSRRDLFAVLELAVFLAIISGILIYFKIYAPFIFTYQELVSFGSLAQKFSLYLLIPIFMELVFLLI